MAINNHVVNSGGRGNNMFSETFHGLRRTQDGKLYYTLRDKNVFSDNNTIQSISGTEISKADFLVNDQGIKVEPFFSGNGPANINYDENQALMNHQGGSHAFRPRKQEIGQFFELQQNYGNVFGNQFEGARADQSRYVGGMERRNEFYNCGKKYSWNT